MIQNFNGKNQVRHTKLYDEYFKLDDALKLDLPHCSESPTGEIRKSVEVPHMTGLPKNMMDSAVNENEKFLNDWQSIIDDKMLPSWKKEFVIYENKNFSKHDLSGNHKESLFKFMELGNG